MRTVLPIASVLVVLAVPAASHAQESVAHVSAGPAFFDSRLAWHVGAGGETVKGSFSIGGEVDYLYAPPVHRVFDNGRGSSFSPGGHALAVSAGGAFYPGKEARRRTQGFVSGGVTVFVAGGVLPAMTLGAGLDWWARSRTGLRVEVRHQFPGILTIGCGVVFR